MIHFIPVAMMWGILTLCVKILNIFTNLTFTENNSATTPEVLRTADISYLVYSPLHFRRKPNSSRDKGKHTARC